MKEEIWKIKMHKIDEALTCIDNFCSEYLNTLEKIFYLHNNCSTIENKNLIQKLNQKIIDENSKELFDKFFKMAFKYNTQLILIQKTLIVNKETH